MKHYKYLVVGGGMTADATVEGIRSVDSAGAIGLFSVEKDRPYDRPPLTKALWKGKEMDSIWRKWAEQNASLHLGSKITKIDPGAKEAEDLSGNKYSWEKLLLATGGTPRRLPFGGEDVIYYRTVEDYRRLRESTANGRQYAVIGAGFIGSEIAAALALNGKEVSMFFPGAGIGERIFPRELSQFVSDYYQKKGVKMYAGARVSAVESRNNRFTIKTSDRQEFEVDGVVAGIGIEPNVTLARDAGLKLGDGIAVDELLRSSNPDVYAAGDVAEFYSPALNKRMRVEHEDNANAMGRAAGRNMAGLAEQYTHLPMFYSDLFDLGYEAVGELDARLETFADWKEPNREGVIYYLQAGRVRGVLLWNVWGQVDAARALIREAGPFNPGNLKGRLK